MYTLDTNTLIYYLARQQSVLDTLNPIFSKMAPVYISAITELELLSFSMLTHDEFVRIGRMIGTMYSIPVDSRMARVAATIRRQVKVDTADATIAATAILTGSTLITRNIRDFERIPNLSLHAI